MKRIVISDKCSASGICVAMSALLEELPNGKARPKAPGILTDQEAAEFMAVVKACPSGAISLVEHGMVKSHGKEGIAELRRLFVEKFGSFRVQKPSSSTYSFRRQEYSVPIPYASGERQYNYRSFDAAEDAGLREFDRVMYSQRRALMQQVLVEYKHQKLMPFNCYEEKAGNLFYDTVRTLETQLKEFALEASEKTNGKVKLPADFERFQLKMDFTDRGSFNAYQLRNIQTILVDTAANRLESLWSYKPYVNTDDIDIDDKRYKVCYDLREVMQNFVSDLLDEIASAVDGYLDYNMEGLTRELNEKVQAELKNKVEIFTRALDQCA